ncbi:MAG: ATP-binding cassette domain-containing protein [Deltaproteobacteria bacterium]|nr:ATP-binding cassette domain-containing protein [Deltaproteobacteria bacterium]
MSKEIITFKNVVKSFGANLVLDKVSFSIFKGEITAIIGKSGIGKSVILKHIIGLLSPDSGEILFEGDALAGISDKKRSRFKQKCSYMFQGNALFDSMTVFDNIALPLTETTKSPIFEIKKRVENIMEKLDLEGIGSRYPSQLSGGMQKRVALARALITEPEILLFDEPTTGLDPIRKKEAHRMIFDYKDKFGFTGVVVSHEIPDIFEISQRVAMIDNKKIIFEGTPEEIVKSDNSVIIEFLSK